MEPITITEVLKATHGTSQNISTDTKVTGIAIDSRTVKKGDLFVALRGEHVDGHAFVNEALQKGAVGAIVKESAFKQVETKGSQKVIFVSDTKRALGDLANYYRSLFSIPFVAVTGSNGKTTTKDLATLYLGTRYRVCQSQLSFNSLVGVPLTIFKLTKNYEVGVLELGTNQPGEINRLAEISLPDIGVITNIAPTHLEGFKTINGVLDEKLQLRNYVHTLILNADDPLLSRVTRLNSARQATAKKLFTFGIKNGDLRATVLESKEGEVKFEVERVQFNLSLFGSYNIYNTLAALSVALQFDLKLKDLSTISSAFKPPAHREQTINLDDITIIDSTYNANPVSVQLALEQLNKHPASRKIAILGDMLELGSYAVKFHEAVAKSLPELGFDAIIGFGDLARYYIEKAVVDEKHHFNSFDQLIAFLGTFIKKGDVILIKGSRAMRMERIVEYLATNYLPHRVTAGKRQKGG